MRVTRPEERARVLIARRARWRAHLERELDGARSVRALLAAAITVALLAIAVNEPPGVMTLSAAEGGQSTAANTASR